MKNTIQNFIPLIRFYQISSDDFFYKVLPYKKLLSERLVYEISEFHMVSNKANESNDLPFPRQSHLIKYDTVLIVSWHFDIFTSWSDKKEKDLYYDIGYIMKPKFLFILEFIINSINNLISDHHLIS